MGRPLYFLWLSISLIITKTSLCGLHPGDKGFPRPRLPGSRRYLESQSRPGDREQPHYVWNLGIERDNKSCLEMPFKTEGNKELGLGGAAGIYLKAGKLKALSVNENVKDWNQSGSVTFLSQRATQPPSLWDSFAFPRLDIHDGFSRLCSLVCFPVLFMT